MRRGIALSRANLPGCLPALHWGPAGAARRGYWPDDSMSGRPAGLRRAAEATTTPCGVRRGRCDIRVRAVAPHSKSTRSGKTASHDAHTSSPNASGLNDDRSTFRTRSISPDATAVPHDIQRGTTSHTAWYPTRHDIPRGMISHAAWCPATHRGSSRAGGSPTQARGGRGRAAPPATHERAARCIHARVNRAER